jgi:hypothetical protein
MVWSVIYGDLSRQLPCFFLVREAHGWSYRCHMKAVICGIDFAFFFWFYEYSQTSFYISYFLSDC